jgi:thiamine pyridinylase
MLGFLVSRPLSREKAAAQAPRTQLRVVLYGYIPDAAGDSFAELQARIKREFQTAHPEIELLIRPMVSNPDLYQLAALDTLLNSPVDSLQADLVEVDAELLGDLADSGWVSPWLNPDKRDWYPAARLAVTRHGTVFGVPHWLCAHFVISRDSVLSSAPTVTDLVAQLRTSAAPGSRLVGDFDGSWNLPSLYLDAWADTHGSSRIASAVSPTLDSAVAVPFATLASLCRTGASNPCLDAYHKSETLAADTFARGAAAAFIGYSEMLYTILKVSPTARDSLHISSASLGNGNHPVYFADAFARRRRCQGGCARAAVAFTTYMLAKPTYEWILLSRDAPVATVPRYLLPATRSAFGSMGGDRFYNEMRPQLENAGAFPNSGLAERLRKAMRAALENLINATP